MPGPWRGARWRRSWLWTAVPSFLLPQRFDLARQLVVLAVEMVVDRHHPAVVGIELGAQVMDGCAAAADVGHPLELRLALVAAGRPVLLDVEVEAGGDIGDQRGFPADEDGEGD